MFGFNMNMGSYQATIEIYIGNQLVSSKHMQAPDIVLQMQFINIVQQLSQDKSQPMSVKMIVPYEFYCEIDDNIYVYNEDDDEFHIEVIK